MMVFPASSAFSSDAGWDTIARGAAGYGWKILLTFALLALGQAPQVWAGSFSINPVRIQLSPSATSEVLHVTNSGKTDVTVQLHPMQWTQQEGEDQLKATRDLIVTPQIFNLKAGSSQIIRIGLTKKNDSASEVSYRLIIEEIPSSPEPGFQGLRLALRISLPVFVKPTGQVDQSLEARVVPRSTPTSEQITLELVNTGRVHVQLHNLKIHTADTQEELLATLEKNIYLLAGQKKRITLKAKNAILSSDVLLIRAETSNGKLELHAKSASP